MKYDDEIIAPRRRRPRAILAAAALLSAARDASSSSSSCAASFLPTPPSSIRRLRRVGGPSWSSSWSSSSSFEPPDAPPSRPPRRRRLEPSSSGAAAGGGGLGMYVHVPYCRRRCDYCDFAIVPIGVDAHGAAGTDDDCDYYDDGGGGFGKLDRVYRRAVLDEIDVLGRLRSYSSSSSEDDDVDDDATTSRRLRSVYFGGGTPSLAPPSTISAILDSIRERFVLDDGAEVTMEMDPGTFDLDYLVAVRDAGINRVSLGVQSFDDRVLASLGRVHRSADVHRSVEIVGMAFGIDDANYSIDLMSGVPGLTLAGWANTLREAVSLRPRPTHLSLYDLQVEDGTAFGRWYGVGEDRDGVLASTTTTTTSSSSSSRDGPRPALPSAEDCAFMYAYASGYLRFRDYEHYEISSYAYRDDRADGRIDRDDDGRGRRSNNRGRHNQIYWEYDGRWHAVGLGATSNVDGTRYARPRAFSDYVSWTEGLRRSFENLGEDADATRTFPPWLRGESGGDAELRDNDEDDHLLDIVMTRLRTSEGLDLDWVAGQDNYDETHVEAILRGFELALDLKLGHKDASPAGTYGCVRLNDPKGFLFSNHIISSIFMELSEVDSG